jgi:hypothetical protein
MNSWPGRLGEVTRMSVTSMGSGHGGLAWPLPLAEKIMHQPQDGAVDTRTRLATINSHLHSNIWNEPEDARLTGGTRSLTRRLLGLNIVTTRRKLPEAVTGPIAGSQVA